MPYLESAALLVEESQGGSLPAGFSPRKTVTGHRFSVHALSGEWCPLPSDNRLFVPAFDLGLPPANAWLEIVDGLRIVVIVDWVVVM